MLRELGVIRQNPGVLFGVGIVAKLRDTEVEDLCKVGVPILVDQNHVFRLDVPVNDAGVMRILERAQHVPSDVQRPLPTDTPLAVEEIREQNAVQKLEHHVERAVCELAEVRHVDAVRMVDTTDCKRLALEALVYLVDPFDFGVEQLQRQRAPNRNVLREIDAPHPTRAQDASDSVPRIQDVADPRCLLVRGHR